MVEMKDSGVEWIGEIPKHWTCCKQKYMIKLLNGRAYSDDEFEENGRYRILRVGNLQTNPVWYTSSLELDDSKYCVDGDLLYSWSMSYAPVIWHGEKVIYHYHIWKTVLAHQLEKKFAYYYLLSLTNAIKAEVHETTMGFITMGIMNNSYIAYPSTIEQQRITAYLDKQCAEIDALSADIQAEIDTLEEYKKSIVSEAVTHGVNRSAPMKNSGLSWIQELPEHWEVIPSKYLFANSDDRKWPGDVLLTASQNYGIIAQDEYMQKTGAKIVLANQGIENWKHVEPNDFVISLRSFQGGLEMSETVGCITWHYVVLKATRKVCHRFYKWLFKSSMYINALQRTCTFIRDGQDLRFSNFAKVPLFIPPIDEQEQIADYLDERCRLIDETIADKQKQLAMLAEYKKSVIYEYVTGKKEVPAHE